MFGSALPNSIRKKSDSIGPQSTSNDMEAPDWVCTVLNTPVSSISQAQVDYAPANNGMKELYPVLCDYFAHYAVNVDEKITPVDSNTDTSPLSTERQVTGRLSSLWFVLSNFMFSTDGGEAEVSDGEEAIDGGTGKMEVPPKATFHFGLGNARVEIDGKPVCIIHKAIGPPVALHDRAIMYRQLHLFAKDADTIKELCDAAFKWDFIRSQRRTIFRAGKYELYTLIVSCGEVYWNSEGHKASRSLDRYHFATRNAGFYC